MPRPEYPTSIRLTSADKRRLRKHADKFKHSLAGLIQMILMQWLEAQEKRQLVGPPEAAKEEASEHKAQPVDESSDPLTEDELLRGLEDLSR
jgi:hypothetical protein